MSDDFQFSLIAAGVIIQRSAGKRASTARHADTRRYYACNSNSVRESRKMNFIWPQFRLARFF